MNITAKDWSNTGFFLVHRAAEVVWWAGAILGQGEDVMAAVIAGLLYIGQRVITIIIRVVALA